MAAAFLTAILKTTFQSWAKNPSSLEILAKYMNSTLLNLIPVGNFAAVFIAKYDVANRRLDYINCGHQPEPWNIPGETNKSISTLCDARNMIMGVSADLNIVKSSLNLAKGDTLLFVSDGVTENMNIDDELYGEEKLESVIREKRNFEVEKLVEIINLQAQNFPEHVVQSDDRTILGFKIKT